MPVHITDDPDVYVTSDELARYEAEYQKRFMMFAGKRPTLAEFIRREQERAGKRVQEIAQVIVRRDCFRPAKPPRARWGSP